MHRKTLISTAVALLGAGAVAACGGGNHDAPEAAMQPAGQAVQQPVQVGDTLALTVSGKLVSFNRAAPATLVGSVRVSGLDGGEKLMGMDLRPADGLVYAVSSQGKVYTIDPATGAASVKSTLVPDAGDASAPFAALDGTRFGVDFNPTVDRLRVVSDSGQNLRINVDTGATTTDTALNLAGGTPAVVGAAYTNSFDGATATQLFDLNAADGQLYLQSPPNDGTLAAPIPLGVDFRVAADFDIDAVTNVGHAVLAVNGKTQLYRIDLDAKASAATAIGDIGTNEPIVAMALANRAPAATVFGLTTDNRLVAFDPRTPNTITSSVALAAPSGESVVGIDTRPIDGMLYAVTRASDGTGRVYAVDAASGTLAPVATISVALQGGVFSVDFNPAANALRIISETGQSLAVNLTSAPGTATVNGSINAPGIAAPSVIGAAYLNSGISPTPPAATTLYSLEASTDVLATQVPATGTLTTVGALNRDIAGQAGFDIAGNRNGRALAAFGAGPSTLFEVNLGTGATVLPRGLTAQTARIGGASGPALRDIAIRS